MKKDNRMSSVVIYLCLGGLKTKFEMKKIGNFFGVKQTIGVVLQLRKVENRKFLLVVISRMSLSSAHMFSNQINK